MSTEPIPPQATASIPSMASPATTPVPTQGVAKPNTSTPALVPCSITAPVSQPSAQNTPPQLRAAQSSHKVETNGLLAGGAQPPSTPRKQQKKDTKKSNKMDFRADDETRDRIHEYMVLTGVSASEALRQLVQAGMDAPRVIISPKTPPAHLEAFIGCLRTWVFAIQAIRSRLNAPLPSNDNDPNLIQLVRQWRATAEKLHEEVPVLLQSAKDQFAILITLTPERVQRLRKRQEQYVKWKANREKKFAVEQDVVKKAEMQETLNFYQDILSALDDLGIKPKN